LTVVLTALLALPVLVNALTYFFQADGKTEMKTAVSYIDVSHLERFNLDAWGEPNGFGGLCYNLVRNGYYPLVLRKFDRLKILAAQVLVLIAPAKPFTDDQVGVLEEFVRSGGCLILTLGWEEKDACRSLLKQFDIDVENIPLGRIAPSQNLQGLSFNNAWPVTHGKNDTKVLCSVWNYPVAVLKRHAKGAILFVGDSSFLLNKNLEGLYNYSLSNIMFLKRVFNQNPMASGDTQ